MKIELTKDEIQLILNWFSVYDEESLGGYAKEDDIEGIFAKKLQRKLDIELGRIESKAVGEIWLCPNCGKSNFEDTNNISTMAYYPPRYKDGKNINPDRNIISFTRHCANCNKHYDFAGNSIDGWSIKEGEI